jgi:phage/plasmid-associated DNA primase
LSTSLVTGGRTASSGATPDLAMLKGKRLFVVCEPNPTDKLQSGVIKGLSGNDVLYFRKLYEGGSTMEIMGKLVIVTNSTLDSLGRDKAYRSRMVVIPFESTFTDGTADRFSKHTFKRDYDVETKLWDLRETFMSMIVEDFEDFKLHGPQIPDYVDSTTIKYISENNTALKFIEQNIMPSVGSELRLAEVYASYRRWMDNFCPGKKVDNLEMFRTELLNDYDVRDSIIPSADYK